MVMLGIGYRDREAGCTQKTFMERLAAQAVTRVRRNLLPLLRWKTPQVIKENGKKERKRGSPRATRYNEILHIKTISPTKKSKGNAPTPPMPPIGSMVSEKSATTVSALTENGSGITNSINKGVMKEVFEEYLKRGGTIRTFSDMEKIVDGYEKEINDDQKQGVIGCGVGCELRSIADVTNDIGMGGIERNAIENGMGAMNEVGMGIGVPEGATGDIVDDNESTESEIDGEL